MDLETLRKIIRNKENERVEFKEWKSGFSTLGEEQLKNRRDCLLGYCVALGNEGGGHLLIGVNNEGEIVGTSAEIPKDIKKQIYDRTGQKISINEVFDKSKKRVLVVTIPSRGTAQPLRFAEVPLMRVHESIEIMPDSELKRILMEGLFGY